MSGLEFSRSLLDGRFPPPPIGPLMGFTPMEFEKGRSLFCGHPGEHHLNPFGTVHGGFAATLLDTALAAAVHTTLPAGVAFTTVDLKVTFVRPITKENGPVLCEGTVLHRGRSVATAKARLTSESDGRLLAHGTATCLIASARESD
jgi:uncharacterized protein (TIGR00369 family)